MGFTAGVLLDAERAASVLPPWLSGIRCSGTEAAVGACQRSEYGEASTCGEIQRLHCSSGKNLILTCPTYSYVRMPGEFMCVTGLM